jgi:hypothetical protein
MIHSIAPILPFCKYYGNPAHKTNSATFFPRISFVIIVEIGTLESCLFYQIPKMEANSITTAKSAIIFCYPLTKNQGTSTFHSSFPHQGQF